VRRLDEQQQQQQQQQQRPGIVVVVEAATDTDLGSGVVSLPDISAAACVLWSPGARDYN